ncbi:radical SAM protein [uncultured Oscillibacter sp.]|uniref:radical SAM protein n=1 Tax=uncultured Oscillibacter sp. TaxID=876091 RepID=UPI002729AFF9|nr:radical SAM protein [uncultured Oscillibacter sp.]
MHYTGTIWRPPYEASSLLLEVTAGCTHHSCKFCTLYNDLPFKFRMSPLEDVESDLQEAQLWSTDPIAMLTARLQGLPRPERIQRTFLVGANPFVLKYERLMAIADLIQKYVPSVKTIGCFARITDVTTKSDEELASLHRAGYDGLTIGIETGDDEALRFMNKGYTAADIVKQCSRLDRAGIHYNFFYLVSISGAGRGEIGAKATADICNQLHPIMVGANMLTIYPDSELYQEIQLGNWNESGEIEKYKEIRTLLQHLEIPTQFAALGASNAFQFQGTLPEDKDALIAALDKIIDTVQEDDLRKYRKNLPHL